MVYTNEIRSFSCDYLNNQTTVGVTITADNGNFKRAVQTITFTLTGKFTTLTPEFQEAVDAFVTQHAADLGIA